MKSYIITILITSLLFSCGKNDDNINSNNQFIPNISFNTGSLINTSFPQYQNMALPGNFITLSDTYGINGVVVFYSGGTNYSAFELSDPNHALATCSTLAVEGIIASCNCEDGNSYDILNGVPQQGTSGPFVLKRYFVEVSGDIIRVFNN